MIIQDRDKHISLNEKFIGEGEFLAFISIVCMMSTNQENNLSLTDLFFKPNRGPFYKGSLVRNRFFQILKYLISHDGTRRMEGRTMDKFSAIRGVLEMIASIFS